MNKNEKNELVNMQTHKVAEMEEAPTKTYSTCKAKATISQLQKYVNYIKPKAYIEGKRAWMLSSRSQRIRVTTKKTKFEANEHGHQQRIHFEGPNQPERWPKAQQALKHAPMW